MNRYEGRTAVITGGASGMGLATTALLAGGGARVIATGRTQSVLGEASRTVTGAAQFIRSDAAVRADIDGLASLVEE